MGSSWYKKSMPKISVVKENLDDMVKKIMKINGVKSVLAWGSFIKNKPNSVIRDLDLIAVSDIFSEDLLSITDDEINSPFNLSTAQLEDEGFDPKAVKFTKSFLAIKKYNVDHWAISSDKKIFHWGACIENKDHWNEIKTKAEKYAKEATKIDRKNLHKASQRAKNKWTSRYDHWVNKYLMDIPKGWFELKCNVNEVLKETKNLGKNQF